MLKIPIRIHTCVFQLVQSIAYIMAYVFIYREPQYLQEYTCLNLFVLTEREISTDTGLINNIKKPVANILTT